MGHRGYISSRKVDGGRVPQHVQNLVIRNYAERNSLQILLSSVEVAMKNSYLMLEQLLDEIFEVEGIICYSLFQLPQDINFCQRIFDRVIQSGRSMHFALEGLSANDLDSTARLLDIVSVGFTLDKSLGIDEFLSSSRAIEKEIYEPNL